MPRQRALRGPTYVTLLLAVMVTASGCASTTPEDRYVTGWDAICADIRTAYQQFRTDLVTAARARPDDGDAAAAVPLPAAEAVPVLDRPARKLGRALRGPLRAARRLDPPTRWQRWHADAVTRMTTQVRVATAGTARLAAGDAEALPSIALGGFGPAALSAPPDLRERTPVCVSLR